jgi:hypothetical protein
MKHRILLTLALAVLLGAFLLIASPAGIVHAATVTVTPTNMNGWWFYDDGFAGGVGNLVTGPSTPPMGTGSVNLFTPGTSRFNITTQNHAGTRLDDITNLEYSTYRSSADPGNILAISLQFDMDYDLTDTTTTWQGRMTYEPYITHGNTVTQNTWQTWDPMAGKWWMSSSGTSPVKVNNATVPNVCPQSSPCTWAALIAAYPNAGLRRTDGRVHLRAGGPTPDFNGNADALTIGVNGLDTTYDFEPGTTALQFVEQTTNVGVGGQAAVLINLNSVTNLYGYQFEVTYDATKVSAVGSFNNNFFSTTTNAFPVPGWNAACAAGVCKFAATRQNPATPLSGSGTLAFIVFTGVSAGSSPLSFNANLLSDKDGNTLAHTAGTGTINVAGSATITGKVALQGRATPITAGTVTITDSGGLFPQQIVNFDATTGDWSATVPALAGGTNYDLTAAHSLYLSNQKLAFSVTPGGSFTPTPNPTVLRGGDATNDGTVDIGDLTCIGGDFGGAPSTCGGQGSSDINADTTVNILDLVLAGGNYGLATPQPW